METDSEMLLEEKDRNKKKLSELTAELEQMKQKKHWVNTELKEATIQDYFKKAMKYFDQKSDIERKSIIPEVIIRDDHTLELRLNPDPNR